MERLRALEHGRAVLVASTSGITAVIRPDGTVVSTIGELVNGHLVLTVPLRDDLTIADRVGAVPEWIAVIAGFGLVLLCAVRRRRGWAVGSGESTPTEEQQ